MAGAFDVPCLGATMARPTGAGHAVHPVGILWTAAASNWSDVMDTGFSSDVPLDFPRTRHW
ncbi:hypothetical protein DP107_09625 [Haloglomus irregulare]|uniref:Uncharacterized protein n=1 Tax=Haloglomus irregulare TaxID=2234134 RepID=A0A554N971_9EURY|nr:hypothetical protein DP107_09625 [Haloglomus irregulare]